VREMISRRSRSTILRDPLSKRVGDSLLSHYFIPNPRTSPPCFVAVVVSHRANVSPPNFSPVLTVSQWPRFKPLDSSGSAALYSSPDCSKLPMVHPSPLGLVRPLPIPITQCHSASSDHLPVFDAMPSFLPRRVHAR